MVTPQVQYLIANADQAGQRIDNYLCGQFRSVPKTRFYKALRKGEIRVNSKRVKATYRLQKGDQIRIPPLYSAPEPVRDPPAHLIELLKSSILHEDDELLVINKPPDLAVHGGSGIRTGIIECLRSQGGFGDYLELAHRLDRPTSGCLLIAKSRRQLLEIQESLQNKTSHKKYLCLVKGHWHAHSIIVDDRLLARQSPGTQKMVVDSEGKDATSCFQLQEIIGPCSLMKVSIDTGRTHQIRVHASASGYPLVGDARYGDFAFNRQCGSWGLKRLFLHAEYFEFQTRDGKRRKFRCPLYADLDEFVGRLRES